MNAPTYCLYGGGNSVKNIDAQIVGYFDFFVNQPRIITYIPAKAHKNKRNQSANWFKAYWNDLGFNVVVIDIFDEKTSIAELLNAPCIYMGGGNTYIFNHQLQKCKFRELLIERQKKGPVIIAGFSAGAMVLGQNIGLASITDEILPDASTEGMKFLLCNFVAHYNPQDANHIRAIKDFFQTSDFPVVAISENSGLIIDEQGVKAIGAGVYIFKSDGSNTILNNGDAAKNFLMTSDI
jgi:peptidase E